jgi:hypothetical protein
MDDLIRLAGVLVVSSLFLLGLATLIQIVEQLVREPGVSRHHH